MNTSVQQPNPKSSHTHLDEIYVDQIDAIEFRDVFLRLRRGLRQSLGLALLGLAIGAGGLALLSPLVPASTSTRVVFSFPGIERGENPDKSKFQPDDLRAPAIVAEAMRRQGLDTSEDFQAKIRNAITIEGIIPDAVVKARDRLRATGPTPPIYIPDEYTVTLTANQLLPLTRTQREHFLVELVNAASDDFKRTYGQLPVAFGGVFETLRGADFPEYEIVFNHEIANLTDYLTSQVETAKSFRSPTTNLSFKELLEMTNLFSQIQLNEVLGVIHENGLARNRQTAILRMDHYLKQLSFQENHAIEDEKVVRDLLTQAQGREQNYALGVKSQVAASSRNDAPVLDQGLIDSLIANDSYNFLVRKALDAGLRVREIQSGKSRVIEVRDNLLTFAKSSTSDQSAGLAQIKQPLTELETNYDRLVENIRKTHRDFAAQVYGHAIQLSSGVRTPSLLLWLAIAGSIGIFIGVALGVGLSLLGIYIGEAKRNEL